MAKRKAISASLRWSIFARDGFCCRYCGSQAGQDGVDLVIDHVISVVDGGDNRVDNLVTACGTCNGGKSGRSLKSAPASSEVLERVKQQTRSMEDLSVAMSASIRARDQIHQEVVNMKCAAYGEKSIQMQDGECIAVSRLIREFGPQLVLEWYDFAAASDVKLWKTIQYLRACARNVRESINVKE